MKAMQDKEFDKVFADAFADMDVQPSAQVWNNIAGKVHKSKRNYRWLALAASLLIIASVGSWFLTDKKEQPEQVVAKKEPIKRATEKPMIEIEQVQPSAKKEERLAEVKPEKREKYVHFTAKNTAVKSKAEPVVSEEKEFKKTFSLPEIESVLAASNDNQLSALAASKPDDLSSLSSGPEKLPLKQVALPEEKRALKRHQVNSIGDLVNLVVAKVDKREDKIIRFTDSDGESNVSGINLGFINIQKGK